MNTTLNIHLPILKQIMKAAKLRRISPSEMIVILLKLAMEDISNPGRLGKMVRYQKRRNPKEWHVFHIKIREDVYEYWLDLRKLRKMSVSLILANAVRKFLKSPETNFTDNYHFTNYAIIKEVIDNVIVWKLIWGVPLNLEKIFATE